MRNQSVEAYLRSGYRYVDGWLYPAAAQAIAHLSVEQRRANAVGGVAEIGVHHGKLFILLYLLTSENEPAVAIDLFSRQELNAELSGAGDLERLKKNLRRYADVDRLVVYEGDSMGLTAADLLQLGGGPLRLISIDGGHTSEITAHDLGTAEGALADDGIIILDDCFNEMWPGVSEGLFRYFSGQQSIVPFGIAAGKTFFCRQQVARRYAKTLKMMKARIITEHDFLGSPVVCLDFSPLKLSERISRFEGWQRIRHLGPAKALRSAYYAMRSWLPH
jgi:hypothetical protein